MWSVLHNEGKHKLDQQRHEQRLDAIALRATEWLIDHGWDIHSNSGKKALHDEVLEYFHGKDHPVARKLFECVVRQDKKYKQKWFNSIFKRSNQLQKAKGELAEVFEKPAQQEIVV